MRQILPTNKPIHEPAIGSTVGTLLANKVQRVVIVGATSGIGRELARLYLREGAMVGVTGRRQDLLDSLAAEFPDQVFSACYDVMEPAGIEQLADLVRRMGGMDTLIYSSGYGEVSKELSATIDDNTTAINVRGFLDTVHFGWNHFVNQGSGRLATISSIASNRGSSRAPAYSASKAFQSNFFEGLAIKARKSGGSIKVVDVQPGFVNTKMAQGEGLFWVAPVEKAAMQIKRAIDRGRRRVYVTRRWALIAWLMKRMPAFIYHKIG